MSKGQTTFGSVRVRKHTGTYQCHRMLDATDDTEYPTNRKQCTHDAKISVLRQGRIEYYCRQHSRDTWLEMAGYDNE